MNKITEILEILRKTIDPKIELNHGGDAYVLLIAVLLSAQATDILVNKVLPKLFNVNSSNNIKVNDNYCINKNNLYKINEITLEELEKYIKSIGLYRNKARNIKNLTSILISEYNCNIPSSRDGLEKLPGIGRKSANIILNEVFDQSTIPVDTHVLRVSNRLGLVNTTSTLKTEMLLERMIPENLKKEAHYFFVLHGRYICKARKPNCEKCNLKHLCEFYKSSKKM